MCGPSGAEKYSASQETSLAQMLQANFQTTFGEQQSVLKSLNNSLSPILAAGPNQQGFNAPELANLNTTAINASGAAARNAEQAAGNALAGRGGGGSSGLESGVDQQIKAGIASTATGQLAAQQNQIQAANYATGRQNFFNAVNGENAIAGQYNPSSYGGEASNANQAAFTMADKIQQEAAQAQAEEISGITSLAMDAGGAILGGISGVQNSPAGASQPGAFFSGAFNSLSGGGGDSGGDS